MTKIAFQRVCVLWKKEKKRYVKVSTMAAYSLIIQNHLEPRFKTLDEITSRSVQTFVNSKLKDGLGATTVKGILIKECPFLYPIHPIYRRVPLYMKAS